MIADLTPTHLKILQELRDGTLAWGAAVGACWPALVRAGYVQPNFGGITPEGTQALAAWEARK